MSDFSIPTPAALAGLIAARAPGATLGWRDGAAVSHAQFLARARAWAALLRRQDGRDFALYLDDSIEFGAALLGAWRAGKTVWLSADTLEASCAALRGSVRGFLGEFPASCAPLLPEACDERAAADDDADPGFAPADAVALVVHTSGSTGAAQAIPKRWSQLGCEVATLEAVFGARVGAAAVVATVSHQHIYGLLFKVLWPLAAGRPIHAASLKYPEQLAAALAAGPGVLIASPAHLKRLPEHLSWGVAAEGLRAVFSSGGPLAADVARATGALLGQVPVEVYGSSETGGIAWRQRAIDQGGGGADDESWFAFPGVEWRLAEPDGQLEVRSNNLADAGWLRLADRAGASGPDRFLLLGRSDRIVKIEEKRVSLDALEAALAASDLVAQARVALCPANGAGREVLAAFVVASGAGRALLAEHGKLALNRALRAALAGVVEAVALPRRWRYLDQMPQDAQGKTTHAGLLALLDDAPEPASASTSSAPTRPAVRLLEQEPLRVLLELCAPANLLYFDGHFPGASILPGVVQTDWAIAYGRQYFALPPRFLGMSALKFQNVIRPGQAVRLELLHDAQKGSLNFRYQSEAGQHASGRILFGPDTSTSTPTAKGAC